MAKHELPEEVLERLLREHAYLDAARTLFKVSNLQGMIAEAVTNGDSIDAIRLFVASIEAGVTPPPNILSAIYSGFKSYLVSSGNQTLDYAFALVKKQRVGHPLTHRKAKDERGQIVYFMWCLRHQAKRDGRKLSINKAAEQAINELGLSVDEEALAKSYKSMNADEIFDGVAAILGEHLQDAGNQ